jgi:hypothetical protein
MTRRCLALLLAALVGLYGLVAIADEPPPSEPGDAPLRLKKKPKAEDKKPEPAQPAPKAPDNKKPDEKMPERDKDEAKDGPAPVDLEKDEKEVMERLARNVRSVEERMGKGDLGDATRQLQEDILKDIESLIRMGENPPSGGGGGGAPQDQNQGDPDQDKNDKGKDQQGQNSASKGQSGKSEAKGGSGQRQDGSEQRSARGKRKSDGRQRGQLARGKGRGQQTASGTPQARPGQQQPSSATPDGRGSADNTGPDKSEAEINRIADLNKQDVWGHLPESVRAAMNAYAGRQEFMAKHEALIKKYYSTIAAEGRRKGDQR